MQANFADLKYDKLGVMCFDWDDGSLSALNALILFNTKQFDDGTGRLINWRAAVAVIGKSTYNNNELGENSGNNISYADMLDLIQANWTIANHGLYSSLDDTDPYPEPNLRPWTAIKDVDEMATLIFNRVGYRMSTTAVPGNFQGYVEASNDYGYLAATSQRDDVGGDIPCLPAADYLPLFNMKGATSEFKYFLRFFKDGQAWGDGQLQDKTDQLNSRASEEDKPLIVIGSHDSDSQEFIDFVNYAYAQMAGKIWVVSMKEMMEYLVVKESVSLTTAVSGNKVTISVDDSGIPYNVEFKDISLLVSDGGNAISSIEYSGFNDVTYSLDKGLINIYNKV